MTQNTQLFVLDLDRTLINTNLIIKIIERSCVKLGIVYDHEKVKKLAVEKRGQTFEPLSFIDSHGPNIKENFVKTFFEICGSEDLIYDDANDFFKKLENKGAPYLILTFGPDEWQKMKLDASGLSTKPYLITHEQDKCRTVAEWKVDGLYKPPLNSVDGAQSAVIVDDKLLSFASLSDDCTGYLIKRNHNDNISSELAPNLIQINSLNQITI